MAYTLLLCVVIMMLQAFTVIDCGNPPANESPDEEPFPEQKCESMLNCLCYNYGLVYGISCENMTNFENFTTLLSSGEIFEENSTYEITFTGIQYLPPRSLDGLIVFRLFLQDPNLSTIDKDAFEGVYRLRRFHVRYSKLQEIPDFRGIKDSIRTINIDDSNLTALDGSGLQGLPLVVKLSFIKNRIQRIEDDVFKGTDSVMVLDLSYNLLSTVPEHLFDPMKNLTKLVLSHNQLIHVNQLFAVTHPRFIYLDFNNLSDVDSILYPGMEGVETVALANNPIGKTTPDAFRGKIPKVRFLYLDHCGIRHFNASHFDGLKKLATLDVSFNLIEEVEEQIIEIVEASQLELDFIGNQIRSFKGTLRFTVKRLWLDQNKLHALDETLMYTQIVEVSVAGNELQYLTQRDFFGVHATANLELQRNQIKWIDRDTFSSFRNDLNYLDMSDNSITSLNGSIMYLSQLKALNASDNLIEMLEEGEFTGLNEMSELYLQNNRIKSLGLQLQSLPQIRYIVIIHNNIQTLTVEQIPKNLKYLYLAENPLQCNCRLYPFLVWLNVSDSLKTDIRLCPPSTEEDDTKRVNATCPAMCTCACSKDASDYFMTVNCSSRNLTILPSFLTEDFIPIQDNSPITLDIPRTLFFNQDVDPYFHVHDRVLGIDLENNSLESLQSAQLPDDLLHLYLSNNKLKTVSETMLYSLKNLKRVSLSGNPWDCNCDTIGFKKWLQPKLDIVQDVNTTRCGVTEKNELGLDGKVIWSLTDLDLCPADIGMYVSIAFGVLTCLLFGMATKIVYTRYELHIKVFLYSHGVTWVKEKDLDHDKLFDAFLSFSDKDRTLVDDELLSVIENKDPNIRLCVHYRDFMPGELIERNIMNAVQYSKRTVLILSNNFLESEWCLLEFRTAHSQALQDRIHRIIVIKVGDLPKDIDPTIQMYLESTTYLTWGEKHFWNKLLYVLPTSSTPRNIVIQPETVPKEDAKRKEATQGPNNVGFPDHNNPSSLLVQMLNFRRNVSGNDYHQYQSNVSINV